MYMVVIILRPVPERARWRNGSPIDSSVLGQGSLNCVDCHVLYGRDRLDEGIELMRSHDVSEIEPVVIP